jgi:hypothetical protein
MQCPQPDYLIGLDLGQASEYTGLAVVQRSWTQPPDHSDRFLSHYAVRHLKRWQVQTAYTDMAADLARLVRTPPLNNGVLVVDQTSVGRAVVDFLRRTERIAWLHPIVITGGNATSFADGALCVPKKDLVSCLQVLLQSRRLRIASLPKRDVLKDELLSFRMKVPASTNETLESWRERPHDDLVLAVALALYWAEKHSAPLTLDTRGLNAPHKSLAERVYGPSNAAKRGHFGLRG